MDIKKILVLSAIGAGVYLLISRTKAHAAEVEEEFIPAEKPQQQLDQLLFQASPSTIVERATEEANIKTQQVQQETTKIIGDIRTKADEDLAVLKRQLGIAYELKQEDLIQEYRARDEIIRVEAEQKVQAATEEAARLVEATRAEADLKIQAAREEAYLTQKSSLNRELSNKKYELNTIERNLSIWIITRDQACKIVVKNISRTRFSPLSLSCKQAGFQWIGFGSMGSCQGMENPTVCANANEEIKKLQSDKDRVLTQISQIEEQLKNLG